MLISEDLRPRMSMIVNLADVHIPQVHLTATLPPHLQKLYMSKQKLGNDTRVIRRTTERPEIAYAVEKMININ